jgi:nitrogenase molybdenum-iron protein alpha/beta subunit
MVERILQSHYKTVFIYPEDLRKQILKVLVAKKTDSFVDKSLRKSYIKKLVITEEEILERLEFYRMHMTFKDRCDYVTSDKSILTDATRLFQSIGLDYMGTRYKYKQYEIKDEDMLESIDDFNKLYEECINKV